VRVTSTVRAVTDHRFCRAMLCTSAAIVRWPGILCENG